MHEKLLVATRNRHKVTEYAQMLFALDVQWLSLDDVGITMEVEETGNTFQENAILKACEYAKASGLLTLADDSGLEVEFLNGEPGIYSARYGGSGLSFAQRYQILLDKLQGIPVDKRMAQFVCVIALVDELGNLLGTAEGVCAGSIAMAPVGEGGFGYDPVFLLPDRGLTMAQLTMEEKNKISHRSRALKNMKPILGNLLLSSLNNDL